MAFDIRCPECQAKLRLDEAPDPGTAIECPRCGSQFSAPRKAPRKPAGDRESKVKGKGKGKPRAKGKPQPGAPRKRQVKKKKTNPFLLVGAIVAGFAMLIGVGALMVFFLNRAGKVEEMLTYVPDSCNWARGVNVSQLSKYPGYKPEVEKYMTANVTSAAKELAAAAGHDPESFVDYLVIAKNKGERSTQTMYVLRTQSSFKPALMGPELNGATDQGDGSYKMTGSAPGILAGAVVHMPTNRLVVVIPPAAREMVNTSLAGKTNKDGSFAGQLDATARTVVRGSIWLVVRAKGGLKNYISSMTAAVNNDLREIDTAGKQATTFGVWTTPGGSGVRVGAALQCASAEDADKLVESMQEGPLGKGDESEPTNQLKTAWSMSSDKKSWGEFMQYLSYKSTDECAYIVSTVSGENAKRFLDLFNSPTMATGESSSGFAPPGGPPPGGGGGGERGMPGGIAPPGMAGPGGP